MFAKAISHYFSSSVALEEFFADISTAVNRARKTTKQIIQNSLVAKKSWPILV
jgi:uncharacterized Rmd1/YagE family protein